MAFYRASIGGGGGGGSSTIDYNFVKSVVDSHTHTYEIQSVSTPRISVNEGGVYIDRSNKVVYMYLDFNILRTETPSTHYALAQFSPNATTTELMPANTGDDLGLLITEYTTETNTPRYNMIRSSGYAYIGTSKKFTSGNRSKIYGVWTLYTA